MNNNLKMAEKRISNETVRVANTIVRSADAFMKEFHKSDIFSFSDPNKKDNYEKKYFLFISSISPMLSRLTTLNAELATLLINADKAMEAELTVLCEKKFNAFETFERALYEYTSDIESELSKSTASVVFILNTTQKFKEALNQLIKENL